MSEGLGEPPSAPGSEGSGAECVECGQPIRADVKRCSACGARQVTKGQAIAIMALSVPLWAITVGALEMLRSVDSSFAMGFLLGIALLGPGATLVGFSKYRERDQALRAGGSA